MHVRSVALIALVGACFFKPAETTFDAGVDAAVDAADTVASSCDTPGWILFAKGFDGAAPPSGWDFNSNRDGMLGVDEGQARRGPRSFHAHVSGATSQRYVRNHIRANASGSFVTHVRLFVYVPAANPDAGGRFVDIVLANSQGAILGLGTQSGKLNMFTTQLNAANGEFGGDVTSSRSLVRDAWNCIELVIDVGDLAPGGMSGTGSVKLMLEDAVVPDATLQAVHLPRPTAILLGMMDALVDENSPPLDVWFDEVAISPNPIGCTR